MIIKAIKTTGLSIALAAAFLVAAGSSSAFAQDGRWRDHNRDGRQDNHRERDNGQDNHRERDNGQDNRRGRFEERRDHRFGARDYRDGFRSEHAPAYRRFPDNYGRRYGRGY
jgi:Ni/Co efflux regulator RcnB